MTPIDDNETPDDFTDELDEITEEVEEEDFDIDVEIKRKRRSRVGRRRTTGKEYGTLMSFIAWMAFTIIWLFFFASGYGIIENIAVVFVAFLIVGAASALVWIPRREGLKTKASAISGIGWLVFLILWIVFGQRYFGLYENIGIALASLLVVGLVNMLLHVPTHGEEGGARISGFGGIIWLIFIVLWLPFSNNFAVSVYYITFYQNLAIIIGSFLLMTFIVIAPWFGKMQISVNTSVSVGNRPKATLGLFWGWLVFLVVWLWFIADAYTVNQNIAAVLLSFAVFCGIVMASWLPWARKRGEGPESWFSIGLAFTWVILLTVWFWFFADSFNDYQNFAVFLVSLLVMAAIAAGSQWKSIRDFEAMDWTD
ncbi:hypothetical protein E4H12_09230 [Candidatus Thorarchaeota archaeon]|nr:MAG: hypothetical protein E4H12_09230 [Candidatus Thorarchaeota archaeon]